MIYDKVSFSFFLKKEKMERIVSILDAPTSFEEMSLLIRTRIVIDDVLTVLEGNEIIDARNFLAAWMISRFPETVENTPDEALLASANAVVLCCQNNLTPTHILRIFVQRLELWKNQDFNKLKEDLVETYTRLCDQQLQTPASAEILENTKNTIMRQARKIGGEELANQLSAHK